MDPVQSLWRFQNLVWNGLIAAKLFLPSLVSVQLFIIVDLYLKCVALNFKMFVCHPLLQEKEDMFHILASVLAMGQLKIDANDDDAAYVTNEAAAQRVGVRLLFDCMTLPGGNTLLKSDVTTRDHVIRCRGS